MIEYERVSFCNEEIIEECNNILKSDDFAKAFRMRRLLEFLVKHVLDHESGKLNEYVIGIDVFDRKPDDCIPEDPIVRVQMSRLRKRLFAYYEKRPLHTGIEISIPAGQYLPIFCRKVPAAPCETRAGYLVVQPIRHIAERGEGQAFTCGLYEELLDKLFASFGDVCMPAALSMMTASNAVETGAHPAAVRHCRLIEGSVRVEVDRMRASIRLVDKTLSRIMWAGHFDRAVQFGITEQEELATSICSALEQAVANLEW